MCAERKTLPTETFCLFMSRRLFAQPARLCSAPFCVRLCAILIIERFDIGLKLPMPVRLLLLLFLPAHTTTAHPLILSHPLPHQAPGSTYSPTCSGNLTHLSHASSSRQCRAKSNLPCLSWPRNWVRSILCRYPVPTFTGLAAHPHAPGNEPINQFIMAKRKNANKWSELHLS